ncbi:MAG: hypothetical protein JWN70_3318 [Planctomycetaceae bacterium]|nr:hypothetical protein [Planctomycetaceae bacterium]
MWQCVECQSDVEDNFEICWNCGTSSDGVLDPEFRSAVDDVEAHAENDEVDEQSSNTCLRCEVPLYYRGAARLDIFRDKDTILGDVIEAVTGVSVNTEWLYVYVCRQCGHVEFFAKRE